VVFIRIFNDIAAEQHNIVVNGYVRSVYSCPQLTSISYNLGRDWLVGNATSQSTILPTANMTNTSTYSGQTSFNNFTYTTTATYVSGLLQNTSNGINHYQSVAVNGLNAIDGLVAILTVQMVQQPGSSSSPSRWVPISVTIHVHSY
jgi:hypothetical protein